MTRGFLALGSNQGDRRANLNAAIRSLSHIPGIELRRVARVYETEAVGPVRQDPFLNTVAEIGTSLQPSELLARCLDVEQALGRVRRERQGPRPIDIDVIWLDGLRVDEDELKVPHPEAHRRRFVLVPLGELDPGLELAGHGIEHWLHAAEPAGITEVT